MRAILVPFTLRVVAFRNGDGFCARPRGVSRLRQGWRGDTSRMMPVVTRDVRVVVGEFVHVVIILRWGTGIIFLLLRIGRSRGPGEASAVSP